ncbi:MAG: hypothetical protein ACPIOQ_14965 [Promethearchaeia archaeon]
MNRVHKSIERQGKLNGCPINPRHIFDPKWRPHSPQKWVDPKNRFTVPKSQNLLQNLKDKVSGDISQKYFKGKGAFDTVVRSTPFIDDVDVQEMKNCSLKDITTQKTTQSFKTDAKRPDLQLSLNEKKENFNPALRASLYPNDKGPNLRTSRCNSIQHIETGAAHKSIRTLQNIHNQMDIKRDQDAELFGPSMNRKSILKVSTKSNVELDAVRNPMVRMSFDSAQRQNDRQKEKMSMHIADDSAVRVLSPEVSMA